MGFDFFGLGGRKDESRSQTSTTQTTTNTQTNAYDNRIAADNGAVSASSGSNINAYRDSGNTLNDTSSHTVTDFGAVAAGTAATTAALDTVGRNNVLTAGLIDSMLKTNGKQSSDTLAALNTGYQQALKGNIGGMDTVLSAAGDLVSGAFRVIDKGAQMVSDSAGGVAAAYDGARSQTQDTRYIVAVGLAVVGIVGFIALRKG